MSKSEELNNLKNRLSNFITDVEFEMLLTDIKSFVIKQYTENSCEYKELIDKENIYRMIPYNKEGIALRKQIFGALLNSY